MNLKTQLYIDTSGSPFNEPIFSKVDFFDFEEIELTSTIQNVRDISKINTDFSQQFNLPASNKNNIIFKHYYNTNVDDGFDARIKQRAEIRINGLPFKSGYISLTKAQIEDGQPKSYSVIFYGSLTNLGSTVGDAMLSDLSDLDKYSHDYNIDNVFGGFNLGIGLNGNTVGVSNNRDIIYPSISATDKWYYDTHNVSHPVDFNQGLSVNLYCPQAHAGNYGINWITLKPAIKAKHIISAISAKYQSIDFSDDFFGTNEFNDLYLLLHNNKGILSPTSDDTSDKAKTYRVGTSVLDSDFSLSSAGASAEQRPMETRMENAVPNQKRVIQYHVTAVISSTVKAGGGTDPKFNVEILDGNTVLSRWQDITTQRSFTHVLCSENSKTWNDIQVKVSSVANELATYELDLELKRYRYKLSNNTVEYMCDVSNFAGTPVTEYGSYGTSPSGTQTMTTEIQITKNIPKMKIVDFLKGVFKAFNLTAYVNDSGITVVEPLSSFYDNGSNIDITKMINSKDLTVKRMPLFKNIEFKYKEPKTFGLLRNNQISQSDYGNLSYQTNADGSNYNLSFDGKDYKINLPFEKIYYERLSDEQDTLDRTSFSNGWLVNDDQSPVLTSPVLFFNMVQAVDINEYQFGFLGKTLISQYNRASNTNAIQYYNSTSGSWYTSPATKSLNFNTEFDEFTSQEASLGLFRKYYEDYVTTIFNSSTRVFELEMKADLKFLLRYKLNDTLTIKGDEYLINNIRTNLTTGMTKLELILKFFTSVPVDTTGATLTAPVLSASVLTNDYVGLNWTENPADQILKGYRVYIDYLSGGGFVLLEQLLLENMYLARGLSQNTSYDFRVTAYDSQGNESPPSNVVTTTTSDKDTTPPTSPTGLGVNAISGLGLSLAWLASTDDVGVDGYEVYVDDVLYSTVSVLYEVISGLTSGQTYDIGVLAYDNAGNKSTQTIITVNFKF